MSILEKLPNFFSTVVAPTDVATSSVSSGVATSSPALGDVRLLSFRLLVGDSGILFPC